MTAKTINSIAGNWTYAMWFGGATPYIAKMLAGAIMKAMPRRPS